MANRRDMELGGMHRDSSRRVITLLEALSAMAASTSRSRYPARAGLVQGTSPMRVHWRRAAVPERDGARARGHALPNRRIGHLTVPLRFRRDASRYVGLVHLYGAFGIAFLRGRYRQVLGPRCHPPKLADGLCRHSDVWVHFNPHLIWQATKSYVERGGVFGLVSHTVLPHCLVPTAECRRNARGDV